MLYTIVLTLMLLAPIFALAGTWVASLHLFERWERKHHPEEFETHKENA